jgi:hypothetical protein
MADDIVESSHRAQEKSGLGGEVVEVEVVVVVVVVVVRRVR